MKKCIIIENPLQFNGEDFINYGYKCNELMQEEKINSRNEVFFSLPLKYAETDLISTMSWNSFESYSGKVVGV